MGSGGGGDFAAVQHGHPHAAQPHHLQEPPQPHSQQPQPAPYHHAAALAMQMQRVPVPPWGLAPGLPPGAALPYWHHAHGAPGGVPPLLAPTGSSTEVPAASHPRNPHAQPPHLMDRSGAAAEHDQQGAWAGQPAADEAMAPWGWQPGQAWSGEFGGYKKVRQKGACLPLASFRWSFSWGRR